MGLIFECILWTVYTVKMIFCCNQQNPNHWVNLTQVWVTSHSKIRLQKMQFIFPLKSYALWQSSIFLKIGLYSKEKSGEIRSGRDLDSFGEIQPENIQTVRSQTSSAIECVWVCVSVLACASPASFGREFPTETVRGWQISNQRCVTLSVCISQTSFFSPKTLDSDCLEVIKNPNTRVQKKRNK